MSKCANYCAMPLLHITSAAQKLAVGPREVFSTCLGIFGLSPLANQFRVKKIAHKEQCIMAYGGLRGAVGFFLVMMIDQVVG